MNAPRRERLVRRREQAEADAHPFGGGGDRVAQRARDAADQEPADTDQGGDEPGDQGDLARERDARDESGRQQHEDDRGPAEHGRADEPARIHVYDRLGLDEARVEFGREEFADALVDHARGEGQRRAG